MKGNYTGNESTLMVLSENYTLCGPWFSPLLVLFYITNIISFTKETQFNITGLKNKIL